MCAAGPLERRFPDLGIPRLALGVFPSPIERLPLRAGATRLWVKREDLSGAVYGGNKVRKLEYLLAWAQVRGRGLLSCGADGSHHLVATAWYARKLGLPTFGVFAPQPPTAHVRENRALLLALLERWIEVPARPLIPLGLLALRARLAHAGTPQPLSVPAGGSSPLGCLGWVAGGLEIAEQVQEGLLPEPAEAWLPLGSGGNAAGLLIGLRLAGLRTRVMAVRVVEFPLVSSLSVRLLVARTLALLRRRGLRLPEGFSAGRVEIVEGFLGPGYGAPTPGSERALALARDEAGLALDPTYTAKALAACLDHHARGDGADLLFLDTVNSRPLGPLLDQVPSR